ncbi:ABC transporter substrate-binding protein [Aeromicrobium marinum]|uniref:ABC transporter substrate-binding protein n=1 Tax=Aeromicrobium marinum TaxID=219314 RepID=UPI0001BCC978|nr:ABC transporter substrate-binding protein [Aeromicrobium marinum]
MAAVAASSLVLAACSGGDDSGGGDSDSFQIAYNGDGGHDAWVDAVSNQLRNNLDIDASGRSYATFDELRNDVVDRTITTAFRTGWQPDYPSIYNYLQPLYFTGAGSNDGDYSSEEFDDLMTQVSGAQEQAEAFSLQEQAQEVLLQDLPAIPLWYSNVAAVAALDVENVSFTWQNLPDYVSISKPEGGPITVDGSQPQNPLVPSATNETGGGNVIDNLWEGLVRYESDGTAVNAVAESITSEDNLTWTVVIKDGQQFADGTPVTASSFVDAWNYGAVGSNAQLNSYFYYPIAGFDEAQADEADGLSGLTVVDDSTFTIELNQPEASFPDRLGYSAFYPLPATAFDDLEAFGRNPIGNGVYRLAGPDAWEDDVRISLVPNENYVGDVVPANDGITFTFYTNLDAAYTDVQAGNLDVLKTVPDSALTTYETDENVQSFNVPGSVFQSFTIPFSLEHFGDDEEGRLRRQAISLAINREEITDAIFNGSRTPARDFSSPVMPGYNDALEGSDVLEFDPERAKDLWEQANEINPWNG